MVIWLWSYGYSHMVIVIWLWSYGYGHDHMDISI